MIKKFLIVLIAIAVALTTATTFASANTQITEEIIQLPVLSQMSDEQLLLFLANNNIVVPVEVASTQERALELIRFFIAEVETNPNISFGFGFSGYNALGNAIKDAVINYYGIDLSTVSPQASHGMTENSLDNVPENAYRTQFNCYAYAIGNYGSNYNPGCFSGFTMTDAYLATASALDLAYLVKNDLKSSAFDQQCVTISYARPTLASLSGRTAICVRKGIDTASGLYDYHFMKLGYDDMWHHSPDILLC